MNRLKLSRRSVLAGGVSLTFSSLAPRALSAAGAKDPRFLVVLLRGAVDGLAVIPPLADPAYSSSRGKLALSGDGDHPVQPLDDFFFAHPALEHFSQFYKKKEALVLHAVATPYRARSHFDGQDVLETGLPHAGKYESGWLNRAIMETPSVRAKTSGLTVGFVTPLIMLGPARVMGWSPAGIPVDDPDLVQRLKTLYQQEDPGLLRALTDGVNANALAGTANVKQSRIWTAQSAFVEAMTAAARFMAGADGPRIGVLSSDGWDLHANEGALSGRIDSLLRGLDQGVAAFAHEAAAIWKDTVILFATEFGRTVKPNGSLGTDHGTGTVTLLVGGAVKGGRVIADWPGLDASKLLEGRDLQPTIDFRAIAKGVLKSHFGIDDRALSKRVFPDSEKVTPLDDLTM